MKRREAKRKRLRESAPIALTSLMTLTRGAQNVFDELCTRFVHSFQVKAEVIDCGDPVIEDRGLEELLAALSNSAHVQVTAEDVLRVTSRLQRSQSTLHKFYVAELCFAISQAQRASSTHERRRRESECEVQNTFSLNDEGLKNETQVRIASPEGQSINIDDTVTSSSNFNRLNAINMSLPLIKFYKEKVFDAICTRFHEPECEEESISTNYIHNNVEERKNDGVCNADIKNNTYHSKKEWCQFLECLHTPLPMTIRVHCNEINREALVHRLLHFNKTLRTWLKPALCLPPSMQVYSCSNATYHNVEELQLLCRAIHSSGGASFQELVSTLPAIALQAEPHHRILDMCAAPGSKTLHILDCIMHTNNTKDTTHQNNNAESMCNQLSSAATETTSTITSTKHKTTNENSTFATINDVDVKHRDNNKTQGVVVANEKDFVKATQTLPARLKRFHAPNVLCTRCDATKWPHLYKRTSKHKNTEKVSTAKNTEGYVESPCYERQVLELPEFTEQRFDRILCDVPCSGDGTIRKERSALHTWSSAYVQALVPTQQQLLRRGLDMLAVNGILVYSTCSLNPLENENVIVQALKTYKDSVELLDVNAILRKVGVKLHSCGGIAEMETLQRVLREILASTNVEKENKMDHTHTSDSCNDDDNKTAINEEKEQKMEEFERRDLYIAQRQYDGAKLLRVLPHRDNTGGFFIAALRKVKMPDWSGPTITQHKLNQWTRGKWWRPVRVNDPIWVNITDFYGLDRHDKNVFHYYTEHEQTVELQNHCRTSSSNKFGNSNATNSCELCGLVPVYHLNSSGGWCKRIVLVTIGVAEMLFATRPFKGPGVEIVSAGMRAFEKLNGSYLSRAACRWRATMESSSYIAPHCALAQRIWTLHLHEPTEAAIVEKLLRDGFVSLHECGHVLVQKEVHKHNSHAHSTCEVSVNSTDCNKYEKNQCVSSYLIKHNALETLCKEWESRQSKVHQTKKDETSSLKSCSDVNEWVETLSSSVEVGGIFVAIVDDKHEYKGDTSDDNKSNNSLQGQQREEVNCDDMADDNLKCNDDREKQTPESKQEETYDNLCHNVTEHDVTERKTWYLTANLTSGKVELTVDTSLRAFGLLVYFGSRELLHITEGDKDEHHPQNT